MLETLVNEIEERTMYELKYEEYFCGGEVVVDENEVDYYEEEM